MYHSQPSVYHSQSSSDDVDTKARGQTVRDDTELNTVLLHQCVDRMREGDPTSRDELLRRAWRRLDRLARKMFRRFPSVQRWVDVDDVLQNAALRLLRALEQERPTSTRGFFGLAAEQMRRELVDLARHFLGPRGEGA